MPENSESNPIEPLDYLTGSEVPSEPQGVLPSRLPRDLITYETDVEPKSEPESAVEESPENILNKARLAEFEKFTSELVDTIRESDFEYGFDSITDIFLRSCLDQNQLATKEWLNDIFIRYFEDRSITTGILRVIAHLDYEQIAPQGPTIAIAALSHSDAEVREGGVRALENWGTGECLKILRAVSCQEKWLQDYVNKVIADLEKPLANAPAGKKD